jgi:hypothetical protein
MTSTDVSREPARVVATLAGYDQLVLIVDISIKWTGVGIQVAGRWMRYTAGIDKEQKRG